MTGTLLKRDKRGGMLEALVTLVASGNYATGGDVVDFAPLVGFTNKQPTIVSIRGIAGYIYEYDSANKKVIVRQVAGGTPTGTITQPSFTVATGTAIAGGALGLDAASVAGKIVGGTAVTTNLTLTTTSPVGTPTFTGAAVAAAAASELPASSYPAGVTGDTVVARCTWFL